MFFVDCSNYLMIDCRIGCIECSIKNILYVSGID